MRKAALLIALSLALATLGAVASASPVLTLKNGLTYGGLPDRLCVYATMSVASTETTTYQAVKMTFQRPPDLRWLRVTQVTVWHFTDSSTNSPTAWHWDFGDGGTSTQQNPSHEYRTGGTFDVSLTVSNAEGSNTITHGALVTIPVTYPGTNPGSTLTVAFGDLAPGKSQTMKVEFQMPIGSIAWLPMPTSQTQRG